MTIRKLKHIAIAFLFVVITIMVVLHRYKPEQERTVIDTTTESTTVSGVIETVETVAESTTLTETEVLTTKPTTHTTTTEMVETVATTAVTEPVAVSPEQFRVAGVVYSGGYKYTYYSERVLPGNGLKIPGRYSDGNYVRDEDGYIVLASRDFEKGTVINTPFGAGKVYDWCPTHGTIDVYVSW